MTRSQANPNKVDRYFAAKSVLKKLEVEVKLLEDEIKGELAEKYLEDGTDRLRSPMFGAKAGSISVVASEPEPPELVEEFKVIDEDDLLDWIDETDPDTSGFAVDRLRDFAAWWFADTGECPGGCTVVRYETQGKPAGIKYVRAQVKEDVVIPLLQSTNLLGEVNQMLLGDGE